MEISNMPNREFKVMVVKILTGHEKEWRISVRSPNKEIENLKKNQSEMKNSITKNKNTGEGINSRLEETEEQISDLEDREMELERKKK